VTKILFKLITKKVRILLEKLLFYCIKDYSHLKLESEDYCCLQGYRNGGIVDEFDLLDNNSCGIYFD
jgi:hypothetical protein